MGLKLAWTIHTFLMKRSRRSWLGMYVAQRESVQTACIQPWFQSPALGIGEQGVKIEIARTDVAGRTCLYKSQACRILTILLSLAFPEQKRTACK